jgi:hypothetical protein
MLTSRSFGPRSNDAASIDTRLKLGATWFLPGQVVRTFDKGAVSGNPLQQLRGKGYSGAVSHSDRHLSYIASYLDVSPEFRSPLGFVPWCSRGTTSKKPFEAARLPERPLSRQEAFSSSNRDW